jgi:hypoxanthine phosphoribosyltransferase
MHAEAPLKVLISEEALGAKVAELGARITQDYAGKSLVVLPVLKGSFVFAADLIRSIDLPLTVEFLGVQSYGDATKSSGIVRITLDLARSVEGLDVLIVEDIVDTGLTCSFLMDQITARGPASVKLCSLLHKPARAVKTVTIDYLGFTIPDEFVVGYGLDGAQLHRNLPDVRVIE